ncbi:MAG: hypothetical protein ACI4NA_05020 [Succinivibrio sp.]
MGEGMPVVQHICLTRADLFKKGYDIYRMNWQSAQAKKMKNNTEGGGEEEDKEERRHKSDELHAAFLAKGYFDFGEDDLKGSCFNKDGSAAKPFAFKVDTSMAQLQVKRILKDRPPLNTLHSDSSTGTKALSEGNVAFIAGGMLAMARREDSVFSYAPLDDENGCDSMLEKFSEGMPAPLDGGPLTLGSLQDFVVRKFPAALNAAQAANLFGTCFQSKASTDGDDDDALEKEEMKKARRRDRDGDWTHRTGLILMLVRRGDDLNVMLNFNPIKFWLAPNSLELAMRRWDASQSLPAAKWRIDPDHVRKSDWYPELLEKLRFEAQKRLLTDGLDKVCAFWNDNVDQRAAIFKSRDLTYSQLTRSSASPKMASLSAQGADEIDVEGLGSVSKQQFGGAISRLVESALGLDVADLRSSIRKMDPYLSGISIDPVRNVFIIGSKDGMKQDGLSRHPSTIKWWPLQGAIDHEFVASFYDSALRNKMYSARPYPVIMMDTLYGMMRPHEDRMALAIQRRMLNEKEHELDLKQEALKRKTSNEGLI